MARAAKLAVVRPVIPKGKAGIQAEPFRDAEETWFWTMAALAARRDGARDSSDRGRVPRPCDPDDVIRWLNQIYQQKRIGLVHVRILRVWGERGIRPDPMRAAEQAESRLWREALDRLEWVLRMKGVVGQPG